MIFKTLNNDLTVFNKTLIHTDDHLKLLQAINATVYNKNGAFNLQGLLVNSSQSVSTFTKLNNAFKAYNGNLSKSTQLQNAYVQAVGKQNITLGNYLAGLNGAKASMGGYVKSLVAAKAASIRLQAASIALNTAISMGITLAISALISAITKWVNKEKEAREEAIENAKAAKEESNNLSELLNKYNQLSKEVKSNQGIKEDLLSVQSDLLEALGIEASQIDKLIEKYGDLNSAINQITLDSLRDAQGDLMVAIEAYEKDLIKVGKDYAHWYSFTDRNLLSTGQSSTDALDILEKAGIISSGSHGEGGGALVLTGNDKTVEGILENYQKLKDAQEALNTAIDNGEIAMEEMIKNPLYNDINSRLDELEESIGNYNTAIADLNKNMAQQQILKSLAEQSSIPETKEEFDAFQQSMIDTAIASTKFKGSQDDIRDSIINVLSVMPEFKKYFEELNDVQSSTLNIFSDIFSLKSTDDTLTSLGKISESIDTIQNAYKTLYDAIEEYNEEGAFSVDTLQSVIALGDDWLDYLVDEDGTLKLDKESLEELTQARLNDMRVQAINNVIDNVSKIQDDASANEYLKTTNYALAESYEEVAQKALESANAQMQAAVAAGTLSQANMDAAMNKANADISKINKLFANTGISTSSITGKSGKSSSNSSSTGDYEEQFDFFERRVEVLDNAVSLLKANLENLTGSFAKNQLLDQNSSILEERMRNYSDAVRMYQEKAQESLSKLDSETQKKIINGSVNLTDYVGEGNKAVVEAMNNYKGWSDKVAKCTEELSSLKEELRQLELDKFNHIIQDFTDQFDLRDNAKNLIDKQIDLFKEAGELIGESFYTAQIDQSQKQLTLLENEKAQLVNQMTSAIGSGRVQKGTEEWLEMVNALSDVDGSILDCKKSIEEIDNAILNLHTEVFNRIQEQFSNFDSEISNIIDLFDDFEVSDDKGIWSKEGIAQLGLLSQQYELAQYRVQQYNDEIDELNALYLAGKYSATEYGDKLAELSSGQWDAVQASESAKDAIMDLNEARVDNAVKGIEKEIDAYKELIDAQLDALRASKDLHDYEKSIAEKTKSVTDLERQIAAMQNDTSAATVAKRKQLEQQLADAKADLEEAEYEHSVEVQEDALNKQYEAYEKSRNEEIDKLRESLNNKESILAESFNTVKNNASTVGQEIATIATQHGITVSKALISSWQSGENAIASYGEVLTPKTSAFVGNVRDIETEVYNLQEQADATAGSLAETFSAKADALVTELITSYDAASNLALMTDALHNSLINTLQSGYDVSSLVSSLNAIADAANRAKIAVDRLGNLPSTNVPQSTIQHGITDGINTLYSSNNIDDINKWLNENKSIYSLGNVMTSASGSKTFKVKKYASGAKNIEKDQLAITNEAGQELIYHAADGSILTPLRQGDKVFGNEAVNRLWQLGQGLVPPDMTKNLAMPTVLPNNVNNNSVNVHYDSMITVQGSLNSTDVKQMEAIVDRGINKLVNRLHDGLTYGK